MGALENCGNIMFICCQFCLLRKQTLWICGSIIQKKKKKEEKRNKKGRETRYLLLVLKLLC